MKYKVGDQVLIRDDLKRGMRYYNDCSTANFGVNSEMSYLAGMIATIVGIENAGFGDYGYHIDLCPVWYWSDAMFSGLVSEIQTEIYIPEELL